MAAGIPLSYFMLLWASRDALIAGKTTSLSQATAFLSADCTATALEPVIQPMHALCTGFSFASPDAGLTFWWEPLEMCRKVALNGWVMLIPEEFEQARVLIAILISVVFVALLLSIKPHRK